MSVKSWIPLCSEEALGTSYDTCNMYKCKPIIHFLTTSNIISMGLFTKALGSAGRGSIWSKSIGELGYWGTAVLKI